MEQNLDEQILKLLKNMKQVPAPLRDNPERIQTSSPMLNWVLGGGIPRERITQLWGAESDGKSLMAEIISADVTRAGGRVVYFDLEGSYNHQRGGAIGIDKDKFVLLNPQSGEDTLKAVNGFVESKLFDLIVIDSIPMLSFLEEADGSVESKMPGYAAFKLNKFFRQVTTRLAGSRTAIIVINQIREKIAVMYGSPEYFPGGRGLKHAISINLKFLSIQHLVEGSKDPVTTYAATKGRTILGHVLRFRAEKQKAGVPGREGYIRFLTEGAWCVDEVEEYIKVAQLLRLFTDSDGVPKCNAVGGFWLNGTKLGSGSGLASVIDAVYSDEAIFLVIKQAVDDHLADESCQSSVPFVPQNDADEMIERLPVGEE